MFKMKLQEIKEGEPIVITVKNKEDAEIEYRAQVLFCKQDILFIDPIRVNDRLVSFKGENLRIMVTYVPKDEMPVLWKGCTVKDIVYGGKRYHILYCVHEGKHINRRETYRQYVGYNAILQLGPNRKTIDVTVKDISVTGISFVSVQKYEKKDIGLFHLNYTDEEFGIPVQVSGEDERIEELPDTRTLYGCSIVETSLNIGSYIAHKQKKEAKRRRLKEAREE